jgi:hypothetical protein
VRLHHGPPDVGHRDQGEHRTGGDEICLHENYLFSLNRRFRSRQRGMGRRGPHFSGLTGVPFARLLCALKKI